MARTAFRLNDGRFRTFARDLASLLRQPLFLVGVALIALTWTVALTKMQFERVQAQSQSIGDARNYALLFEQDVLRTVSELDRIIKYLRQNYERSYDMSTWVSLVTEEHTINSRTVQIAIIQRDGMMLTSSAMLHPKAPVDLSDREHFRVHVNTEYDRLFISRPVIGRASNKWSIQFTRPFRQKDGQFGGVIVVSLDPEALVATYSTLAEVQGCTFILLGSDDVIRASAGPDVGALGSAYREVEMVEINHTTDGTRIFRVDRGSQWRLTASRRVGKLPLEVMVSAPQTHAVNLRSEHRLYVAFAMFISLGIAAGVSISISRQRRRLGQITTLAHTDILTGVLNRHSFQMAIENVFRLPRTHRTCALHLIDLDRFKSVNDTFGHHVGDLLLKAVAARIRAAVRPTDFIFRLGGDEFAVLQTECFDHDQASIVAGRLCRILCEDFAIDHNQLRIGASIGVVLGTEAYETSEHLLQCADAALYHAKSEGRGIYRFYDRKLDEAQSRRRQLEVDLTSAVAKNQLEIHYQPKIDLQSASRVIGFEALVRWRHPVHGLMPPLEFIQIAEDTGAILSIGTWVLEQACRDFVNLDPDWNVAINCSAAQLLQSDVHKDIANVLLKSGLDPHRLEIEITETMLMRNDRQTLQKLEAIRALGVRISLDDFGTGYSSLSYLHTYPVDCIKIDRSFVKTIGCQKDATPIIRTIVAMARELNLTTVAEGVETAEQAALLADTGCTAAQGYLFSPPKPLSDILAWIEAKKARIAA